MGNELTTLRIVDCSSRLQVWHCILPPSALSALYPSLLERVWHSGDEWAWILASSGCVVVLDLCWPTFVIRRVLEICDSLSCCKVKVEKEISREAMAEEERQLIA